MSSRSIVHVEAFVYLRKSTERNAILKFSLVVPLPVF